MAKKGVQLDQENFSCSIQDREKEAKLLHQEVEAINLSADKTVEDSEKIFTELIRFMEKRSSDVKQQVRSQQITEVSRAKELQEMLEQGIAVLKRNDAELQKLSDTEDVNQFLYNYPSLSPLSESTEVRDKLQDNMRAKWRNVSLMVNKVLLPPPEPKIRTGFLENSREITLDQWFTTNRYVPHSSGPVNYWM